ncbi:hypothetical protein BKA93DRAFT_127165 [Sparassis latifolia]
MLDHCALKHSTEMPLQQDRSDPCVSCPRIPPLEFHLAVPACISASKMEMEVHAIAESSHSTDVRRLHSEVRDLSREIPSLPLMCYGHLYKCSYIPTSGPLPYPKETRERREQVRIGQVKTPKWNHLHSPCTWGELKAPVYPCLVDPPACPLQKWES